MSIPYPGSAAASATSAAHGDSSASAVPRSGADPGASARTSAWTTTGPTVWTTEARDALTVQFRAALQRGVHGLCFSPYLEGQQPGSQVGDAQIHERLKILKPHAGA